MKFATAVLMTCLVLSAAVSAEAQNGRGFGNRGQNQGAYCPRYNTSAPTQQISAEEAARLLFMREEEKLAMDVYQALTQKYPLRIFRNIASSEKRHFEAIKVLIDRYDLSDPARTAAGEFSDPALQDLYGKLIAQGSQSLTGALMVGVQIEEKDISDLKDAMALTDNLDIVTVYGNLLNGSLNHFSAFKSHLQISNKR